MEKINNPIIKILKSGGIGLFPTDTLYGLIGSALKPKTVKLIYQIRKRTPTKPLIILIGQESDLDLFGVKLTPGQRSLLATLWPGPVSVILPCSQAKFSYLHRDTKTLAFRLPYPKALRELLIATGPLVAPSANPEGFPPAKTITEARAYFGHQIDFYQVGRIKSKPSTLVKIDKDARMEILRQGKIKVGKSISF
ncbi:MAG: threonylcarbamoyl-AMP synthase [Candidatus Vogelbacteria bacterium CG22_combo_CG10-13_8_21_14_all_37_9]|uniref:L-threonylcarbamoyladenylate synthase n=1 Tax=Candidatus Vogelbacteria bacterium CG22_combo_CG10-13_8_21_14_all_37_9 TaxID=1975046 RepID=A0A2H0BL82_9BACT|nr:MAG: threonylcarbamoyl-AMP synthase [Candidatus Vogelbacteria bacterium CG22_combo_CG10-13_8_21_14_all_37_9]